MAREWLITNGLGSYASGTVSGVLSRRYHGLLVAALAPPLGRTVMVAKFDETANGDPLSANAWNGRREATDPVALTGYRLDGSVPTWTYQAGSSTLTKKVWMEPQVDTTYVTYEHTAGPLPIAFSVKALVNYRGFHHTTRAGDWQMRVEPVENGLRIEAFDGAVPFYLLSNSTDFESAHEWYRDYFLVLEALRGLDDLDDHLHAATITQTLAPGAAMTIVATTDASSSLDGVAALARRRSHDHALVETNDVATRLALAADQFIVSRGEGRSVIAGYHWFGDWGRDTMIALPGLALSTGRAAEAAQILRTYGRFVDQGMLPNRFPDDGDQPEYNTVDATLWYFEAIRAHHEATADTTLVTDLFPVLVDIIRWHQEGTRYGIGVDPADGLLAAGEEGVQLTWMDAKVGDWVVTPRIGKPVEVNALWYNALSTMADFAPLVGQDPKPYTLAAEQVSRSFDRFWNPDTGYLYDVIDGPDGDDAALRPNQLLAVSLHASPLDTDRQRAVVDVCSKNLLTPMGLRTLGPDEPGYKGRYGGGPLERDAAYHQGTVWPWLIGPYATAHLRVYNEPAAIRSMLEPLVAHLLEKGSITECAEGDPPHTPIAAIAQAWSVGEMLRVWRMIEGR